jgi:ribosome biogenesis protein BRX1
MSAYKKI